MTDNLTTMEQEIPPIPPAIPDPPAPEPRTPDVEPPDVEPPDGETPDGEMPDVALYEALYPQRAALIRRHGGVPPDCTFGPPDEAMVRALIATRSPAPKARNGLAT